MTAGRLGGVLRRGGDVAGTTFLELFFDLAFAFAISRISEALFLHLGWRGAIDTTEVVAAIWYTWLTTVWLAETLDAGHLAGLGLTLALMFGALVFAASVGGAYTDAATTGSRFFALSYVCIRLTRGVFLTVVTRGDRWATGPLAWAALSAPLWLVGGFVSLPVQELVWVAALAADYTGAYLGWPLPGYGRTQRREQPVPAAHLADRCRTFIIIALGETVLTITARFGEEALPAIRWLTFLSAFVLAVLFWRLYIFRAGEMMHHAIAAAREHTLFQHGASVSHLVMVLGIVFTNAGLRLTIFSPRHVGHGAWTLLAGPAIFLAGRSMLEHNVFRRLSVPRLAGMAAVLGLFAVAFTLPAVALLVVIDVILLAVAVADTLHWRARPGQVRQPA